MSRLVVAVSAAAAACWGVCLAEPSPMGDTTNLRGPRAVAPEREGAPTVAQRPAKADDAAGKDGGKEKDRGMPEEQLHFATELKNQPMFIPQMAFQGTVDNLTQCHMDRPEDKGCPLSGMNASQIYKVFPSADSRTACIDGSPYYFEVRRGDPEKLMFQFQGGGACWTFATTSVLPMCSEAAIHIPWMGIFNESVAENPYKDWTVVYVMYCSGDLFAGDVERPWGKGSSTVQIRGYNNANSALQWALGQFPRLSQLMVGGFSAGSLATQLWADTVLKSFSGRNAQTVILADSFVGALWPPTEQQTGENFLHKAWGMCDTPLIEPDEAESCKAGSLLVSDKFLATMRKHPGGRFAMVNSKADVVQILFEKFLAATITNLPGMLMRDWEFYEAVNLVLEKYVQEPNYDGYLVDKQQHCFTPLPLLFTATPLGPEGGAGSPTLVEWTAKVQSMEVLPKMTCLGESVPVRKDSHIESTTYCDSNLMS